MPQGGKSGKSLKNARPPWFMDVDVDCVFFTHSRIRPFFSGCGRRLKDTLASIEEGETALETLPQITILATPTSSNDGLYFSLNNRRLWVLKQLKAKGVIDTVKVRVKDALPRELEKYYAPHVTRQSMATLMREKEGEEGGEDEDDDGDDEPGEKSEGQDVVFTVAKETATKDKKKAKTAPLSSVFLEVHLKSLKKLAKKGSKKAEVQLKGMIDELIESGEMTIEQESLVWAALQT